MSKIAAQIEEIFNSEVNGQFKQCKQQLKEFFNDHSIGDFISSAQDLEYKDAQIIKVLKTLKDGDFYRGYSVVEAFEVVRDYLDGSSDFKLHQVQDLVNGFAKRLKGEQ